MVNRYWEINKKLGRFLCVSVISPCLCGDSGCLPQRHEEPQSHREHFLDSQLLSQSQFQPVHLTMISFVIVTAQVQQSVQDQLLYFI